MKRRNRQPAARPSVPTSYTSDYSAARMEGGERQPHPAIPRGPGPELPVSTAGSLGGEAAPGEPSRRARQ